jgi:hypothetical protein
MFLDEMKDIARATIFKDRPAREQKLDRKMTDMMLTQMKIERLPPDSVPDLNSLNLLCDEIKMLWREHRLLSEEEDKDYEFFIKRF